MSDALVPYKELEAMAADVVRGGLFPGIKTVPQALTLFLVAQAEGLHPMTAAMRYNVIQNRPALKADAMLASFMERGGTVKWVKWTDEECEAIFTSAGVPEGVKVRWTIQDAERAGLMRNPTWRSYPRQMLKARVASDGVRMADPNVNYGRYTPEEIRDMEPADRKTADYEVVGDEAGNVMSGKTDDPPAPPATRITDSAAPPVKITFHSEGEQDVVLDNRPAIESATGLTTEEYLAKAKKRREEAAAEYAPPPTDDDAPIEAKLEAIRSRSNEKHGRPKSVPDFCKCGKPVMKFVSSYGSREYWECSSRHADRYKLKETGMADAQIRKMIATSNPECFFKDAGKVTQ